MLLRFKIYFNTQDRAAVVTVGIVKVQFSQACSIMGIA